MLARKLPVQAKSATLERHTRHFDAPRERVFAAWFDPYLLHSFMFQPSTAGVLRVAIDARVGGKFSFIERRQGEDLEVRGEYLEIEAPHRIVFTWHTSQQPSAVDRITMEFAAAPGGCDMTLTREPHGEGARSEHGESHSAIPPRGSWTRSLAALARTVR